MLVIVTDYDKRFIGTRHYGSSTTMDNPDWEAHMMDFLHREFPRFYLDSILVIVDDKIVWESFMGSRIRKS